MAEKVKVVTPKFSEKPIVYLKGKGNAVLKSAKKCQDAIKTGAMIGVAAFFGMKTYEYTQAKADIFPRVSLAQYDKARTDAFLTVTPVHYMKAFRDSVLGKKDISPGQIFGIAEKRRKSARNAENARIEEATKQALRAKADSIGGVLKTSSHTYDSTLRVKNHTHDSLLRTITHKHDSSVLAEQTAFDAKKATLTHKIDSLKKAAEQVETDRSLKLF